MSGAERRLVVEHWLLSATADRVQARQEWKTDGVALLRCGGIFGAVRITAAAVSISEPQESSAYLLQALLGGPVLVDQTTLRYYLLVGSTTGLREQCEQGRDDAEFKGSGHYLGVPALGATTPARRSYWCLESGCVGDLVVAKVSQLVTTGRYRLAGRQFYG
ncbi:hypothetical protein ACFV2Z_31715 [Streptomyces sp. NPDC059688]|uniref:hypothetical protein n=1 Tax=Streptomyces sp. NPDC059688 TaxID=3346906 RepID=UPI003688B3FB